MILAANMGIPNIGKVLDIPQTDSSGILATVVDVLHLIYLHLIHKPPTKLQSQ